MEEKKNLTAEEAFRLLLSRKATFQELDDDPRLLKACIVLLLDHVEKLRHRISDLNRANFGRKSERFIDPNQALLFQDLLEELMDKAEKADQKARAEAPKESRAPRKGHGRRKLPETLPRLEDRVQIPEEDRTCPDCRTPMEKIGEEITEKLCKFQVVFVRRTVREKYACPKCHDGVLTAEGPEEVLDRGMFDRSFLAGILVAKYKDHLPLYRQAEMYKRDGIDLPLSTLCDQVALGADLLAPIAGRIRQEVLENPWIQADETPVLSAIGKGKGKKSRKSYIWAFRSKEKVFYRWSPSRSSQVPLEILKGYEGKLQVDDYAGYKPLFAKGKIVEVGCMAHARRKFEKALETSREYASLVLGLIRLLYQVEGKLPKGESEKEIEERLRIRQAEAVPVLDKIKEWLESHKPLVLPKSPIGKAIGYMLGRWESLLEYTRDGRLEIDNNGVERSIRPYALGRKNWLQFGSEEGGRRSAILMTLMENCRAHGVDPQLYLWDALMRIGKCPASKVQDLTPWGWKEKFMTQAKAEFASWQRRVMEKLQA